MVPSICRKNMDCKFDEMKLNFREMLVVIIRSVVPDNHSVVTSLIPTFPIFISVLFVKSEINSGPLSVE